ncbi:MAG: hypothetical protein KDE54_32845 [Caldilineaceae bacterium]|nr:hypothetical protein [Caldilineaceae bacterium]MCB0141367.1 hypothetical protein [Caldilineaceae bacterium]
MVEVENFYMLKEITLSIPEDIYRQVEQVATETQRDVADLFLDTIASHFPTHPAHPDRAAMHKEIAAYKQMHADLVQKYLGEYVAIHQGELVDHDTDLVDLHKRITSNYPGKVILSRRVQKEADPVLHMRSPRLERMP